MRATLYVATLRLTEPVVAANVVHDVRTSLFFCVEHDDARGWSECPVATLPGVDATADKVRAAIHVGIVRGTTLEGPGASAAAGMVATAVLDARLRRTSTSLASSLSVTARDVGFAGVVGACDVTSAVSRAHHLVALGATRIRVKVTPRGGADAVRGVLAAVGVPVVADANGSFNPARSEDQRALHELAELPLAWLEQPFEPGERRGLDQLANRPVRIGADESVQSPLAVADLADQGVVSVVCIKPARVGIPTALEMLDLAAGAGLSRYVGGYFEAGLGRAALGALSAACGDLDGDVVGTPTYLEHDPCHQAGPVAGRQPLHDAPGIGPVPDLGALVVLDEFDVPSEP